MPSSPYQQLTLLRASEPEIGLCQALDELEPHPVLPDVLQLRVHGPQPLKVLPRVLVVDRGCGEACLRGADVFDRDHEYTARRV